MQEPPLTTCKVEKYPLLSLLPEAVQEVGHYGFVEAQLVLNNWRSDILPPDVRRDVVEAARLSIRWALQHQHLASNGDWIVVSAESHPHIQIRLELVSWPAAEAYSDATRH